jgi:mRNA-degrading endonuclease toxin of MazEF toxin-antitoxin module
MASPAEIWLTDFADPCPGEPSSVRLALILGPGHIFDDRLPFLMVAPLTTTRRGIALHIEIEPSLDNGLDETSYAQCELLRSINRRRTLTRVGRLDADNFRAVMFVVQSLLAT